MRLGLITAAIFLAVGACTPGAELPTSPVSAAMPPVEARRGEVGDVFVWQHQDGSQRWVKVIAQTATEITLESETGCTRRVRRDGFAPATEWRQCGGASGSHTAERITPSILPLAHGRSERWRFSGTNSDGDEWDGVRTCSVVGAASVTVPAGIFDTHHVRCENPWLVYEWFVRADGVTVQWARTAKTGSRDQNRLARLVRFTPAPN
ncbi:MAG: hypothetical protein AAGK00_12455 [Pseudomonadota bacterium]